jgi:hypothetical protein
MGAEQSTEAEAAQPTEEEKAATKLQAATRGRDARKKNPLHSKAAEKATPASSVRSKGTLSSTARAFSARFLSWRPSGFAPSSKNKNRGHKDPKKVFEGLDGLSLHAALNKPSQLLVLLQKGTSPNERDGDGDRYPLHWAAARGAMVCLQHLVANGADTSLKDARGLTAAQLATESQQTSAFNFLTYGPAKPDSKAVFEGLEGPSLNVALGQTAMLKHYLLAGGDPDVYDSDEDRTPLHWAAARGEFRCAELLLAKGAELSRKDKGGSTAEQLALAFNQRDVYDLLVKSKTAPAKPYDHLSA